MSTIGFAIGNGESRKDFDLEKLRGHGVIYGCNALYRDFEPDVLCALDNNVLLEITQSGYKGVIGKFNKTHKQAIVGDKSLPVMPPRALGRIWYTGIAALWIMGQQNPDVKSVFCLGYDLYDSKTNNIYKGSLNYERMGLSNMQFKAFREQVFDYYPEKSYYFVHDDLKRPDEWLSATNVFYMDYETFELDWFEGFRGI